MKTNSTIPQLLLALWLASTWPLSAQPFSFGSDGSYGPLNVTSNTVLDLPPHGKLKCTSINGSAGTILRFNRNALNTPVYFLATTNVTVSGTIDVSGPDGGLRY